MSDSTNVSIPADQLDQTPLTDTGYPDALAANDTVEAFRGLGARDFPDHLWIEPRDWKDHARENDRNGTWPENYRSRFTHQGNSHECTCHALIQNIEIAWNRQRQSLSDAVWLSPLSVYAEANPRKWGGSYCQKVLGIAIERGVLPEYDGPGGPGTQKTKFRHTLNQTAGRSDSGPWVPVSGFPSGWKETAAAFAPDEVINVSSWEEHVCLLLHGYAVSNGRSGHSICHVQIVWDGGQIRSKYSDSYNVHRFDSERMIRSGVGGAFAVVTTKVPDNWQQPA